MVNCKKNRLDIILVEKGYFPTREKARVAIMEGKIFVNNIKEDKPGTFIKYDSEIIYKGETLKYVSRGGLKLEKATKVFHIDYVGKICMDIGSSTGGFTDLMLMNGAKRVYAIDSGTNQLDYKLRIDDRVIVKENTNARFLVKDDYEDIDIITIDVSFISLKKIIPVAKSLLKNDGHIIALIKPQFEAGRELVEKNGVIKNIVTHKNVVNDIIDFCKGEDLGILGLDFSPIKGPAGNIEFLIYLSKSNDAYDLPNVDDIVELAHESLN